VTVEIVILAMIAAFLGLRLYSVLGRRAEHEEEPIAGRMDPRRGTGVTAPRVATPAKPDENGKTGATPVRQRELPASSPAVERGLRDISTADRRFDAFAFIDGARGAYRMILEAYWRGDEAALAPLVDADVGADFAAAIAARREAGHVLENRLVAVERATIEEARIDGPLARVTVRFDADIAAVTRDGEGNVIAGSLTDAVETHDVWTFTRRLRASDPNWLLVETDDAA